MTVLSADIRVRPDQQGGPRCLVVWFPDWPVTAWRLSEALTDGGIVAIIEANRVLVCSAPARAEGVRRGQRRREAQSACPSLHLVEADPARDQRLFDPLVTRIDQLAPGVQQIRPGLVAIRARGPASYYGSEEDAARTIIEAMAILHVDDVRVGIADGLFTAEQAAYATTESRPSLGVDVGESAEFLAPWPIERLCDEELSRLLPQLGVWTLGDFALMNPSSIFERFGARGVRLHTIARGLDPHQVIPGEIAPSLASEIEFEQTLHLLDQVAFSSRRTAEEFVSALGAKDLVCTELSVTITGEEGEVSDRVWLHPTAFNAAGVIDRLRWQLASCAVSSPDKSTAGPTLTALSSIDGRPARLTPLPPQPDSIHRLTSPPNLQRRTLESAAGSVITSPIQRVRFSAVAVDAAYHHRPGLFGNGPDERVHHTLSRVQAMLGHDSVLTATVGPGRWLAERQVFLPWGDGAVSAQSAAGVLPWPGQLPPPLPGVVYPVLRPASVVSVAGSVVRVDERGNLVGSPWLLIDEEERYRITAWAGPWAIDERTWDSTRHRRACRFQAVDARHGAWLLVVDEGGDWWIEGRYD